MLSLLLTITALAATPETLDLSIDEALAIALRSSPAQIEIAATRSQGLVRAAQGVAILLPTLSGSLSYGRSETRIPYFPDTTLVEKGWTGSLTLSQVIFDPQLFANVINLFISSGTSSVEARDKQARLGRDVIVDYLNLLKVQRLQEVAAASLARATDNLNLNQEKLRLGSSSPIDVLRAQAFRSQAEIELLAANKALAAANAAFLATLGLTESIRIRPTEELVSPPDSNPYDKDSLLQLIMNQNPGIRLAERAQTAARVSVAAAIARALPQVSTSWSTNYLDSLPPRSPGDWQEHDQVSWGIRLGFPLLDIKSYLLDIAAAATEARRARAGALRARLGLRATATAAILGYEESRQRLDYARRNLELNQELFRLAEEQHRLGSISLTDFQSVETSLAQAQASHIAALCDVYIQAAEIAYLLGITGK